MTYQGRIRCRKSDHKTRRQEVDLRAVIGGRETVRLFSLSSIINVLLILSSHT